MRIEVYLDQDDAPFQVLTPPETFRLDTEKLTDGPHQLCFRAIDDDEGISERRVSFNVQNGPAIAVHGIVEGETLHGQIGVLANAYGASVGDTFEPQRIETPAPVPTWAWVLFLMVLAWGAGYLSLEISNRFDVLGSPSSSVQQAQSNPSGGSDSAQPWTALGEQIYGINCASCHQAAGTGLPGVFPPLVNNAVVNDTNPSDHIDTILRGVSGKVIDGVAYAAPMPPFGAILTDEEIAAVVNHERTQWGNSAPETTATDVAKQR